MKTSSRDTHPQRAGIPLGRAGLLAALDEGQTRSLMWKAERELHQAIQLMTPHKEAYALHFEQELKDVGPVGVRINERFINPRRLAHCPKELWFLPPLLINVVNQVPPSPTGTPRAVVLVTLHGTERRANETTAINPYPYHRPQRISSKTKVPAWLTKLLFQRLESPQSEFSRTVNVGMKLIDGEPLHFVEDYHENVYDDEYRYIMCGEPRAKTKEDQHQQVRALYRKTRSSAIRYVPHHVLPWLVTQLKRALRPVAEEMLIRDFYNYNFPPPSLAKEVSDHRNSIADFFNS